MYSNQSNEQCLYILEHLRDQAREKFREYSTSYYEAAYQAHQNALMPVFNNMEKILSPCNFKSYVTVFFSNYNIFLKISSFQKYFRTALCTEVKVLQRFFVKLLKLEERACHSMQVRQICYVFHK